MNWRKAMEEIKIRNFTPETASKDSIKRKNGKNDVKKQKEHGKENLFGEKIKNY